MLHTGILLQKIFVLNELPCKHVSKLLEGEDSIWLD
jgi:hypothetical protein